MTLQDLLELQGENTQKVKGEHIFMQGGVEKSLYYVQSGLLKAYYSSKEGKESIKSFIFPNNIIGSLSTNYYENKNTYSLICLEETRLIKIPFDVIARYCKEDLEIANNVIDLLLQFAMKKEEREFELLSLSAEERYCKLVKKHPLLLKKVTQNDLSAYLGITPVGLSRIKKRVNEDS